MWAACKHQLRDPDGLDDEFVLAGAGVFVHKGLNHPIGPEDVVFVPGGHEHCFRNTGDATLRFLCLVPLSGA